ncbi:MAG: glutamine amidotransferase-related protein [Myxococcota bacterium]
MSAHRVLVVNINRNPRTLEGCRGIAARLRDLAADEVDVRIHHWEKVDTDLVRRLRPAAVVIGPNEDPFPSYPPAFDAFLGWLRRRRGPTLGICGGHQALALAHGAPVGPVHAVPAATTTYRGMPKVKGEVRIRLLGDPDPLLADLPEEIVVAASHVDEVKEIPPGFRLLALGDPSHVQIVRADRRPMYGVQFHPEKPAGDDAGGRLLANWLSMVLGR